MPLLPCKNTQPRRGISDGDALGINEVGLHDHVAIRPLDGRFAAASFTSITAPRFAWTKKACICEGKCSAQVVQVFSEGRCQTKRREYDF
jgi:hypothetical protein